MKVMVIVKANADSEAGRMPSEQELSEMGAFNEQLVAEGTLLAAQKLQPVDTAQTLRVRDGNSRVLDGPFAETRELLAGFNLIVARDRDEAMRIARDFPWARFGSIEVRPLEDMDAERERCGAPAAAMAAAVP